MHSDIIKYLSGCLLGKEKKEFSSTTQWDNAHFMTTKPLELEGRIGSVTWDFSPVGWLIGEL